MKVSSQFLRDFAYLANLYGWTPADIEDVKAQTRANPEPMRQYWTMLAAAHRTGYAQTEANQFERLVDWASHTPAFSERYAHASRTRTREGGLSDQYAQGREGAR